MKPGRRRCSWKRRISSPSRIRRNPERSSRTPRPPAIHFRGMLPILRLPMAPPPVRSDPPEHNAPRAPPPVSPTGKTLHRSGKRAWMERTSSIPSEKQVHQERVELPSSFVPKGLHHPGGRPGFLVASPVRQGIEDVRHRHDAPVSAAKVKTACIDNTDKSAKKTRIKHESSPFYKTINRQMCIRYYLIS